MFKPDRKQAFEVPGRKTKINYKKKGNPHFIYISPENKII